LPQATLINIRQNSLFSSLPALTSNPLTQRSKTSILDTQRAISNLATQLCENLPEVAP